MFAYDDNNNLISIETNESIKEIMENGTKEEDKENKKEEKAEVISSVKDIDIKDLTLLDSHSLNIYGDEKEEKVEMYVDAKKDDKGNVMWDDGQDWKLIIEGNEYSFVLFEGHLQLASMDFFIYTIDDDFYISTLNSGTANLTLTEYKYNKENGLSTFFSTLFSRTLIFHILQA